jgi:hypothetical protein
MQNEKMRRKQRNLLTLKERNQKKAIFASDSILMKEQK